MHKFDHGPGIPGEPTAHASTLTAKSPLAAEQREPRKSRVTHGHHGARQREAVTAAPQTAADEVSDSFDAS